MKSLFNQMPQVHSSNVYEIIWYECKGIIWKQCYCTYNMIWMQQKLYEINIYWNICVFHDMTLSACNRNIMTKIIQTFTKYCAVAVLQCQWNFGDDVETQFKFNSKSVTLVISTREYYELFQFKMLEINKTSFKYIEYR